MCDSAGHHAKTLICSHHRCRVLASALSATHLRQGRVSGPCAIIVLGASHCLHAEQHVCCDWRSSRSRYMYAQQIMRPKVRMRTASRDTKTQRCLGACLAGQLLCPGRIQWSWRA